MTAAVTADPIAAKQETHPQGVAERGAQLHEPILHDRRRAARRGGAECPRETSLGTLPGAFLFVLAKKKCPRTPKEKSALPAGCVDGGEWVRYYRTGWNCDVAIPKYDTD